MAKVTAFAGILPKPREPNGRLVRVRPELREASFHPMAVKRLIEESLKGVADSIWGSPIGRLVLEGKISQVEFAAAIRWDETRVAYMRAQHMPPPNPKAQSFEIRAHGHEPEEGSDGEEKQTLAELRAIRRYALAHSALCCAGQDALAIVRLTCEGQGAPLPSHAALVALKRGLNALVEHWSLTRYSNKSRR